MARKHIPKPTTPDPTQLKMLVLAANGLTSTQIAPRVDRSPATVRSTLAKFKELRTELEGLEEYRLRRSDLLSAAEAKLLKSVTQSKALDAAPLNQRATALRVINQARRLEDGESTSNAAVKIATVSLDDVKARQIDR